MEVLFEDREWDTGCYFYEIPMPRKMKSALKALDKLGVFPGGLDALIQLIAERSVSVALAPYHKDKASVEDT